MTRRGVLAWGLVLFGLVAGALFVAAALRQKDHLNLSPTAGGQMPYLVYAQQVAEKGLFGHFGDVSPELARKIRAAFPEPASNTP